MSTARLTPSLMTSNSLFSITLKTTLLQPESHEKRNLYRDLLYCQWVVLCRITTQIMLTICCVFLPLYFTDKFDFSY
jgi:hypothetical protein